MKWDEFCSLLAGLDGDTPLGRMVQIRAENDPKTLKSFTAHQHKIRNQWRKKRADAVPKADSEQVLEQLKNAFISMATNG